MADNLGSKPSEFKSVLSNSLMMTYKLPGNFLRNLSFLIKTSKGKEKLMALLQFSMTAFRLSRSQKPDGSCSSDEFVKKLEKTMKDGRKFMKTFMFVDEILSLEKHLKHLSSFSMLQFIEINYHFASSIYYMLDNAI